MGYKACQLQVSFFTLITLKPRTPVLDPIPAAPPSKLFITDNEVYEMMVAAGNIQRMALLLEHFLPALRCLDSRFVGKCVGYSDEYFARSKYIIEIVNRLYPDVEAARTASIAITELQTAQMWAVKALTWKD